MVSMRLRTRILTEFVCKQILLFSVLFFYVLPEISYEFEVLKLSQQGSVLSILGFLMAAGIIGAFELTYSQTNLRSVLHRCLAHLCKLLVYLSVGALMWIGVKTIELLGGFFVYWLKFSSLLIYLSLVVYDIWDIIKTLEDYDELVS